MYLLTLSSSVATRDNLNKIGFSSRCSIGSRHGREFKQTRTLPIWLTESVDLSKLYPADVFLALDIHNKVIFSFDTFRNSD